jgi:hypothetical protein
MMSLRTFVACCLLSIFAASAHGQSASPPEPGPERDGLRLRLLIKKLDQKEGHHVQLEVLNVGKDAITLIGQFSIENDKNYEDYLREAAYFTSYPEVLPTPFSISAAPRESPQPTATISPGDSLVAKWTTVDNVIGGGRETGHDLTFVRNGLFLVRAHLILRTADDKSIKLWSNEQPFIVGGSEQAPKACAASVIHDGKEMKFVRLDVGTLDGIQVGDIFEVGHAKTTLWGLKITAVTERSSTATLIGEAAMGYTTDIAPHVGSKARFVRTASK